MQIRKLVASAIIVASTAACMPQEAALHAAASEAQLPQWDLSDAVIFPASRGLQHAEDGVVLSDGLLLVGDSQHGLVTLDADGTKAPFGNFAGAGFVARPAEGWSNPNGIAFEPDGLHVLIADIVEGKIFRANSHSGAVELIYDHEFGVNTAVADSTGAICGSRSLLPIR